MRTRLTSLALVILVPASAAVSPVHNLLTDATPESAAAAVMRAYAEPAAGELAAAAMPQFPTPILERDDSRIEVRNLTDGVKGVLLHEAMVVSSLGKHGSCPESAKTRPGTMPTSHMTQAPR